MTKEEIVNAAKEHGKSSEFGELVKSELSRGVNSPYGLGFLDGAEWAVSHPQIIEIFGKRVKIVEDESHTIGFCYDCAFDYLCRYNIGRGRLCETADHNLNRHFVEVDEDGNEIGGDK